MIKLHEGLDYSESNYNDFLSDNFVGYEPADDGFDGLMKQLGKVARALHTRAEKLYFATLYEYVYLDDIYVKELFDGYYLCHDNIDFVYDSKSNVLIFKNYSEFSKEILRLAKYGESFEESYGRFAEGMIDITDDFREARTAWNKLNLGISFDDAIEQWNEKSDLAEPTHWFSKPVYSQKAWKDMVQMFSEPEEEPEEEKDSEEESLKENTMRRKLSHLRTIR